MLIGIECRNFETGCHTGNDVTKSRLKLYKEKVFQSRLISCGLGDIRHTMVYYTESLINPPPIDPQGCVDKQVFGE